MLVDKQDNASVDINNNPRYIVLLFDLCNCPTCNLKLVFEVLWLNCTHCNEAKNESYHWRPKKMDLVILNQRSIMTPNPVAFLTQKCLSLKLPSLVKRES